MMIWMFFYKSLVLEAVKKYLLQGGGWGGAKNMGPKGPVGDFLRSALDGPDRPSYDTKRTQRTLRPHRPDFDVTFLILGTLETLFLDQNW